MGKIPCKLCSSCGLYNDLSVQTCECGAELAKVPGRLVDEPIPPERYGEIDRLLPVFVQKCSACGAENFTADSSRPVRVCYNCHKARVASVVPEPYKGEQTETPPSAEDPADMESRMVFRPARQPQAPGIAFPSLADDDGDEDDDDPDTVRWQAILGGVQSSLGSTPSVPPVSNPAPAAILGSKIGNEDEEEDAADSWSRLLSKNKSPVSAPAPVLAAQPKAGQELTLTAVRYGRLSFTLRAGQKELPFLLGRSAGYGSFLSQDPRVSNEHCYLAFQGGVWVVLDNHSTNGTAVNKRFLDWGGQQALHDGDELMLGHHPDSMAFQVGIR